MSSRRLTGEEIKMLERVFGDEIDYKKIKINEDHWTSQIEGVGAFVFGNNIQLSGKYKNDRRILIHETAHVWQFQKTMGWEYFFSALFDHILARIDGHDPYDYLKVLGKKAWEKWGVEQQAQWIGDNEKLPPFEIRFPKVKKA